MLEIDADRVLMRNEEKWVRRIGKRACLQACDYDAASRRHFNHFVRDALFLKNGRDVFCDDSLVAWRIHGIDAHEIGQPDLGFIGQLVELGLCLSRLRGGPWRVEKSPPEHEQNDQSCTKHHALSSRLWRALFFSPSRGPCKPFETPGQAAEPAPGPKIIAH